MDSLEKIIKNLKKEEIRNFKIFMNRFQRNDELKITALFDKLRTGKFIDGDNELVGQLFEEGAGSMNAYYRLKNRLKTELEKSLVNLHHNLDEKINVLNLITLSSIFSYKSQNELSLYYLKKAEKVATQNEFYDLLEFIYDEIVTLSHQFNEINPLEYIDKKKEVAEKNHILMQANHAIASISHRLRATNFNKISENISGTLEQILADLKITSEVYKTPKVRIRTYLCISEILLQNKNFISLENYLINTYKEFEEENFFNKSTHAYKINLITWIINTLLINKKFDQSITFTEVLLQELNKYNKLYYDKFIWTYHQSSISNYMSSNRLEDAKKLLLEIKEEATYKGITFYDYVIHVNLALCYFFQDETSTAIRTLSHLLSKEVYPKLSNELQFSTAILEIILHYENKNLDFVSYRLAEVRRQFRSLIKREDYLEDATFIKIMNGLINKPGAMNNKNVQKTMKEFAGKASSFRLGSGKVIDYGVWVNSKLNKKGYYRTLLDSIEMA
ncbi:MAG: hypothetical protein M3Q97_10460 [Bacteroidota bacterium]|nr:hypothetical protein [Bacteroidota bacterium]